MKLTNSSLMKQHIYIIQKVLSFRDWYAPCSTPWEVRYPWKAWAHQRKYKMVAKSNLFFKPRALHSAHAAQHPHSRDRQRWPMQQSMRSRLIASEFSQLTYFSKSSGLSSGSAGGHFLPRMAKSCEQANPDSRLRRHLSGRGPMCFLTSVALQHLPWGR